mgnify:CR=1 FL=1
MSNPFICFICGKERSDDLYYTGKRKPRCAICEAYRKHQGKAKALMGFNDFEADFLDKQHLNAYGLRRCSACKEAKPKDAKWERGKCWSCYLKCARDYKRRARTPESRLSEYLKKNARKGHTTYGSWEAMKNVRSLERKVRRLARRNAIEAFDWYIREHATDQWVECFYAVKGEPWRNPRLSEAEQYRVRYRKDEEFATKERMRRQIRKAMNRDGVAELMRGAIRRGGQSKQVERALGYTIGQLCTHLERQFTKGMTWDRFRSGDIHIDHITPQAAFDLSNPEQWRACWCLSNLQPRWARDNIKKSARVLYLI